MRCTDPRTVGFKSDGKTISWSPRYHSKEYPTFQLPCGQCIECRLEYARQWAVRCVHEAQMHSENSFITLTYDNNHLKSEFLIYSDFQNFMKRLRRENPHREIGCFVTGEYGEIRKRPHWHALLFNWRPEDLVHKYTNDRGDHVYSSQTLSDLWPNGISELGSVTFESAGYCARYAAKKLEHGHDKTHPYQPISRKSSKYAIGKTWLEKYWRDTFSRGNIILNGQKCSIPRYYEKWLKKNEPEAWTHYVTQRKYNTILEAERKDTIEKNHIREINMNRPAGAGPQIEKNKVRKIISEEKYNRLKKFLKDV